MPYYQEVSVSDPVPISSGYRGISGGAWTPYYVGTNYNQWSVMTTHRTGAPKGNLYNKPLLDISVDKYAYFLDSARDRKFETALRDRGIDLTPMPPDRGHPFKLEKARILWRGHLQFPRGNYEYQQDGWANFVNGLDWHAPAADVDTFAYQSWGRVAPTAVVFDAGVFAGELREGLPGIVPSLLKGKAQFFKDLGSDYLNIEFGWKPFINDLKNAAQALLNAQTAISRPYGPVHRYRETPDSTSSTSDARTALVDQVGFAPINSIDLNEVRKAKPGFLAENGSNLVWSRIDRYSEQKYWFEANFFLLPKLGYDPQDFMSRLDSLVNTKLTPRTLWELAPWSWLIDWGLRIGDALLTAETLNDDRVHAQYAYGMCRTFQRTHISPESLGTSCAYTYERKERVRANPYGFKVGGFAGLNSWQQSILLALGLTKLGR